MFAALGRRGLRQDRADIAYVQIGALAVRDSASRVVVVPGRRLRLPPTGLLPRVTKTKLRRRPGGQPRARLPQPEPAA
jgi:hypothetical protein